MQNILILIKDTKKHHRPRFEGAAMKAFMDNRSSPIGLFVLWGVLISILYLLSVHNYLFFHSVAEIFSIIIFTGVFIVFWNTRRFNDINYLLYLGVACLFIGGIDLLHTLAYKGMGVFPDYGANLPTQLWIASRYLHSFSFLAAALLVKRGVKIGWVFLGYAVVVGLLLMSIFRWRIFPDCYIEGEGLTSFKKISEYVVVLLFLVSAFLFWQRSRMLDKKVRLWLTGSIWVAAGSELAFTLYVDVYGFANLLGHFLKIFSAYCLYRAFIEIGLREPYAFLFRDLKQREEALQKSETRYRAIIEQSAEGIVLYDRTGIVFEWNRAMEELTGIERADAVGRLVWDVHFETLIEEWQTSYYHEQIKADTLALLARDRLPDEGLLYEYKLKNKSGFERTVTTSLFLAVSPSEHIFVNLIRDITERKQVEEALWNSKRLLQSTSQLAEVGSWELNVETGKQVWTEQVYRIHEVNLDYEPTVEKGISFYAPEHRPIIKQVVQDAIDHGDSFDVELRFITAKGNPRWVRALGEAVRQDGATVRVRGAFQDITKRKRAEEALRESERRYRTLVDNFPNGIVGLFDHDLHYITVGGQGLTKSGLSKEIFEGKKLREIYPPEIYERDEPALIAALEGESRVSVVPYGDRIFEVYTLPVKDSQGEIAGGMVMTQDVTDRKQAEEALEIERERLFTVFEMLPVFVYLQAPDYSVRFANRMFREYFGDPGERPCYEILRSQEVPCEGCFAPSVFENHASIVWEWTDDQNRTFQIYDNFFSDVDGSPLLLKLGIDITDRKEAEETLAKHNHILRALHEVALEIGIELELSVLLNQVMTRARTLLNAHQGGGIALYRGQTGLLHVAASQDSQLPIDTSFKPDEGVVGWVFRHNQSCIVDDYNHWEYRMPAFNDPELKAVLAVPLRWQGELIGVMTLGANQARAPFNTDDVRLVEMFAAQVSVAIENARLYEQSKQDAQTKAELLREVNHRVKNNLTAIIGLLYVERRRARQDQTYNYQAGFAELIGKVQGLATVHRMLSDVEWAPLPLSDLVRQVIQSSCQMLPSDKQINLDIMPSPACVTSDQAHHLALVLNELTTNTLKHALQARRSTQITVGAKVEDEVVQLDFCDDGPGYPEEILADQSRWNEGLKLVENIVQKNLHGELSLSNDDGAVAAIRFALEVTGDSS